jgi:hypothetical protein
LATRRMQSVVASEEPPNFRIFIGSDLAPAISS